MKDVKGKVDAEMNMTLALAIYHLERLVLVIDSIIDL